MGSLRQSDLLAVARKDPNLARPVGAVPKQQRFTACRIGIGPDHELSFLDEVPIHVAWDIKEMRLLDGKVHRWWRYEGKVNPRDTQQVRPGQHFVLAEYPYAIERIHSATFKVGSHKGSEERPSIERRCKTPEELLTMVESFDVDYWERGSLLTAGFSMPQMSFLSNEQNRRYSKGALYVLGFCDDFDSTVHTLNSSPRAQELLRLTSNRTIHFWPRKINERLRLYEEVSELGPVLLMISIRQALAGPHAFGERWRGRPVMDFVDRIYRDHLNSYNRKMRRRPGQIALDDES